MFVSRKNGSAISITGHANIKAIPLISLPNAVHVPKSSSSPIVKQPSLHLQNHRRPELEIIFFDIHCVSQD